MAATALMNLQALPRHSAGTSRINVGFLRGGTGLNIVPGEAVMGFETRGATNLINQWLEAKALHIVRQAGAMHDLSVTIRYLGGAPQTDSDPELTRLVIRTANEVKGIDQVGGTPELGASEDAAFMMERVRERGGQAAYIVLGTELPAPHHHPRFDINESALAIGVRLLSLLTARLLNVC